MTIQQGITKAIGAGWLEERMPECTQSGTGKTIVMLRDSYGLFNGRLILAEILLSPAFWQALGKSEGWYVSGRSCEGHSVMYEGRCAYCVMRDFVDALWDGRSIEDAFNEVTK